MPPVVAVIGGKRNRARKPSKTVVVTLPRRSRSQTSKSSRGSRRSSNRSRSRSRGRSSHPKGSLEYTLQRHKKQPNAVIKTKTNGKWLSTRAGSYNLKGVGKGDPRLSSLCAAVVLPKNATCRVTTEPMVSRTSVCNPFYTSVHNFGESPLNPGTPDQSGQYMSTGGTMVAVSRDPLNCIMEYIPNMQRAYSAYQMNFVTFSDIDPPDVNSDTVFSCNLVDQPWMVLPRTADTGVTPLGSGTIYPVKPVFMTLPTVDTPPFQPNGELYFPKHTHDRTRTVVWCDGVREVGGEYPGTNVYTAVQFEWFDLASDSTNTINTVIRTYTYDGDTAVALSEYDVRDSAIAIIKIVSPGWYYFDLVGYNNPGTGGTRMKVQIQNFGAPVVAHRPLPGIFDKLGNIQRVRMIGAALMVTPDVQELARGGFVVTLQLPEHQLPEAYVVNSARSSSYSNEISTTRLDNWFTPDGIDSRDFSLGVYAFHKPVTKSSFKMTALTNFAQNITASTSINAGPYMGSTSLFSPFYAPDGWLLTAVSTPQPALNSGGASYYPGALAHFTYSFSVEFETIDIWFNAIQPTMMTTAELERFFQLMITVPQFHENPFHFSDLVKWLKGAVGTVRKFAPGILGAVAAVQPEFAPAAAAFNTVNQILPSWT